MLSFCGFDKIANSQDQIKKLISIIIYLLFLNLTLYGLDTTADTFGYIRVTIPQQNKAHDSAVTLKLNGKSLIQFSHASVNDTSLQVILSANLLAAGSKTPISSDYSKLQKGCHFDYRVQFSFDTRIWIDLGLYHAPTNNLSSYIPIGICNDGKICSDNAPIKAAIEFRREALRKAEEEQDRKNIELLRAWLEQSLREEFNDDLAESMKAVDELDASARDGNEQQSADLNRLLYIEQNETPIFPVENENGPPLSSDHVTREVDVLNQRIGHLIPPNLMAAIEKLGLPPDILLNYGWVYAGALGLSYEAKGEISKEQTDILNTLEKIERTNFLTYRQDCIKENLRFVKYWENAKALGELGLHFSPMGDLIDFCEMVTGREFCKHDGPLLSNNQRILAAVGIVIGNRQFNGFVESELKTLFKEVEQVLDESGKIKWSKVFSEVESGDLIKQEKKELIEQLRRDKNIPIDWNVDLSKELDGIVFSHPKRPGYTDVRIMSGNPKNLYPNNQRPYVKYKNNGRWQDISGKSLTTDKLTEAHIPIDDFNLPVGDN